jgi:phosphoenolpyruvate-protein kinase (PTS system EI component)
MPEQPLAGVPASPGIAAGRARRLAPPASAAEAPPLDPDSRERERERAQRALAGAAEELEALARRLRQEGRADEADMVDAESLMALDPALAGSVDDLVLGEGRTAAAAISASTGAAADRLAALEDSELAARAADVRSVGRRALRRLVPVSDEEPGQGGWREVVLVGADLGPADVIEIAGEVCAIVLGGGASTAHAAIVARSLGLPMVTGLGAGADQIRDGEPVVVDGGEGVAIRDPSLARVAHARLVAGARASERARAAAARDLPAETRDGTRVLVLANVAGAPEVRVALDAGAEGVGLLRTELSFLASRRWPDAEAHRRALAPVLAPLAGRIATVRVLDFGGDKSPPFITGTERGIDLLLANPDALRAQLSAVLDAGAGVELRILLPMVEGAGQVERVRELLEGLAGDTPPLGAMVETETAADRAATIAGASDFLSIGTNDLTASVLGVDRFGGGALSTHDPRVLERIATIVAAAQSAATPVEVCGEAASDPNLVPLLVGLGVDELSVGAARVGETRERIRSLHRTQLRPWIQQVLAAGSAGEVEALIAEAPVPPGSVRRGDAGGEGADGLGGVVPLRSEL